MYFSFQFLDLPTAEFDTMDQTMITQSRLEFVYARGLQGMEDICVEMNFQNCRLNQLITQIKLSLTSNLDSAVCGVGTEIIHLERAYRVVCLHRCTKTEVKLVGKVFAQKKCLSDWGMASKRR